jgi:cytochrome d ubiquinol oxidase subunit II
VTLPNAIALMMLLALIAYCLSGGADFGGGLWDLLASGPQAKKQRSLIASAISPIWEANHVWLILLVTLLFVCFPTAYVAISIALHIPLTLMLIGIVLRGAAFTFRSYGKPFAERARRWELVFAIASIMTPVMLGIILATLATGRVRAPAATASFFQNYVSPWLAPFPVTIGLFTLGLFALLAAVYLILESKEEAIREIFKRKALGAALVVGALAIISFFLSGGHAPRIEAGLTQQWWSLPFQMVTGISAVGTFTFLGLRRYQWARVFAILQVTLIVCGWALSQYPYLIVPIVKIQDAAPTAMLEPVLLALILGAALLIPSFFYLYRVFKGERFEKE